MKEPIEHQLEKISRWINCALAEAQNTPYDPEAPRLALHYLTRTKPQLDAIIRRLRTEYGL